MGRALTVRRRNQLRCVDWIWGTHRAQRQDFLCASGALDGQLHLHIRQAWNGDTRVFRKFGEPGEAGDHASMGNGKWFAGSSEGIWEVHYDGQGAVLTIIWRKYVKYSLGLTCPPLKNAFSFLNSQSPPRVCVSGTSISRRWRFKKKKRKKKKVHTMKSETLWAH